MNKALKTALCPLSRPDVPFCKCHSKVGSPLRVSSKSDHFLSDRFGPFDNLLTNTVKTCRCIWTFYYIYKTITTLHSYAYYNYDSVSSPALSWGPDRSPTNSERCSANSACKS